MRISYAIVATIIALPITLACSGASTTSTGSSQSALTTDADGGGVDVTACLTSYVTCVRAADADASTCKEDLHACLRPRRPAGNGGPCGPGRGGPGGPRGDGDGDGDRDGDRGDGGAPPPPPPPPPAPSGAAPPPAGGPGACFDALDQCAAGTDGADTCVTAAQTCLAALPPPRPPRGGHDGPPPSP